MHVLQLVSIVVFWAAVAALLWTWLLLPLTLQILVWIRGGFKKRDFVQSSLPSVTVLITAHNEESVIRRRIENCVQQEYPQELLQVLVASDHSTDRTEEIVQSFAPRVELVCASGRGKSLAQNEAMAHAHGEIVVFTDADTLFSSNFLQLIVAPFADPNVGSVTGKVKWVNSNESGVSRSGSSYWRLEHYLWRLENALGVAFTGSGPCLAFRRELFREIDSHFGDDTVLPLDILLQGKKLVYEERAEANEEYFSDPDREFRSRVRMSLRGFRGTLSRKGLLNPFRHPALAPVLFSHKVLRYGTPYFLIAAFVANLLTWPVGIYPHLFAIQASFYFSALAGLLLERHSIHVAPLSAAYSFCAASYGLLLGVTRGIFGSQIHAYKA